MKQESVMKHLLIAATMLVAVSAAFATSPANDAEQL
jgi:hypothetical protein